MMEAEARLLVCMPETGKGGAVTAYAGYLRDLLGGQVNDTWLAAQKDKACLKQTDCDLIVCGELEQSCLEQVWAGQPPASLLWARRPRWPIQNILLILRFEETDNAAVEWLERLALASSAAVTVLPIVPSLPAMHRLGNRIQTGLDLLLSANTPAGRRVRRLARRMAGWQISSGLRLRQGEPEQQIREEVAEGNYDLIVIGAEPGHGRSHHFQSGELVGPLLRWVERPLLIARPSRTS
ncbi:MAG TPA: hypothetical protein EYP41_13055 [Anaerolineae bacterium]|nr:hypothetical protein [Anaerolineae bacterium]